MTNQPNLHPIILLSMGDGDAAFRLASNLKTAWLGSTCKGYNPRRCSLQGHRGTQDSEEGWVFFILCLFSLILFYPRLLLCGSWFWHPLYQFPVCSLLSSSPLGHIHLINQAIV